LTFALLVAIKTLQASPPQGGVSGSVELIEHFPLTSGINGKPIMVEARVTAPGRGVVYLRLYYKSNRDQAFRFIDMRPAAQGYIGQIPANAVRVPLVQYFLVALLSDRSVINYPTRNPYGQPLEILIRENTESSIESAPAPAPKSPEKSSTPESKTPAEVSPQLLDKIEKMERPIADAAFTPPALAPILILSPEPFSAAAPNEVIIAASFMTATAVDSSSIKILLDGREVTSAAEVSPAMVSYTPPQIDAGEHTVTVSALDSSGDAVGPITWRFKVSGSASGVADEPVQNRVSGIAYAEMRREKFNGFNLNNNNVGADWSGNTGALHYSASAYFTSLEADTLQPRHRFVIAAGFPWLNVTLGDATPYFDDLILWGRRVRGFQAGLHTGIVNLDLVTGETVRGIGATPSRFGTFKQNLLGLRPSFGSRNRFLLGFTLLRVRDDTLSLKQNTAAANGRVTPKDNLVLGSDLTIAFGRHRFEIKVSAAGSLLTNDISYGPASKDSVKENLGADLPFDPAAYKKWFILNESTSPLDPRGKTSLAYQVTLNFNYFNQFLTAGYKRIGSEYVSLGHSFLRNDIRGFFINDRWRMMRNRVYLTLGVESYDDHFNTVDQRPSTKLITWQCGAAIFWNPDLPSLNFNFRNNNRNNNLTPAAAGNFTPEDNATRDLSFSLNYDFNALNLDHALMLNLTSSDRVDNVKRAVSGDVASNLKSLSLRTRFEIPLTSTLTFATNDNDIAGGQSSFKYNMFSGRADYDFFQQRTEPAEMQIRAYGAFSRVSAAGGTGASGVIDYNQTGFQLGGVLQYHTQHEFVLDINLLNYKDRGFQNANGKLTPNSSFKNSLIRAYYAFRL
jgi:hypothetical protein